MHCLFTDGHATLYWQYEAGEEEPDQTVPTWPRYVYRRKDGTTVSIVFVITGTKTKVQFKVNINKVQGINENIEFNILRFCNLIVDHCSRGLIHTTCRF